MRTTAESDPPYKTKGSGKSRCPQITDKVYLKREIGFVSNLHLPPRGKASEKLPFLCVKSLFLDFGKDFC